MFNWIDWLASKWLKMRRDYEIAHNTDLKGFELGIHDIHVQEKSVEIAATAPGIAALAMEAAIVLDQNNCENYFMFDCMPSLELGNRPVRITIQWANKLSPGEKNRLLSEALAQYAPDHPLLKKAE